MLLIRGLDLSTINQAEAKIKLDQFHIFLTSIKKHFCIAKINQQHCFGLQQAYLKKQIVEIKQLYDDSKISEKDYQTKLKQLNNQLDVILNIQKQMQINPFQQNFYLMLYDSNLEELERSATNAIVDLEAIGLFVEKITSNDEINVIKNIFNPMNDDISDSTIDENRLDLDNILSFESVKFNKDHILINNQLYLSLLAVSDYPTEIDYY